MKARHYPNAGACPETPEIFVADTEVVHANFDPSIGYIKVKVQDSLASTGSTELADSEFAISGKDDGIA